MTMVIRCGWLFDGTGVDPLAGAALIVEGDRVREVVAPGGVLPGDAKELDLGHLFVMPGLIDGHTHLSIIPRKGDQLGQLAQLGTRHHLAMIDVDRDRRGPERRRAHSS